MLTQKNNARSESASAIPQLAETYSCHVENSAIELLRIILRKTIEDGKAPDSSIVGGGSIERIELIDSLRARKLLRDVQGPCMVTLNGLRLVLCDEFESEMANAVKVFAHLQKSWQDDRKRTFEVSDVSQSLKLKPAIVSRVFGYLLDSSLGIPDASIDTRTRLPVSIGITDDIAFVSIELVRDREPKMPLICDVRSLLAWYRSSNRFFRGVSLWNARAVRIHLPEASFIAGNFRGSVLRDGSFEQGKFEQCQFNCAVLNRVNFRRCIFIDSVADGASLRYVDFTGADIRGLRVDDADLTGAKFDADTQWDPRMLATAKFEWIQIGMQKICSLDELRAMQCMSPKLSLVGRVWKIELHGKVFHAPNEKGWRYIATLLEANGKSVSTIRLLSGIPLPTASSIIEFDELLKHYELAPPLNLAKKEVQRLEDCLQILWVLEQENEDNDSLREEIRNLVMHESYGSTGRIPSDGLLEKCTKSVKSAIKKAIERCEFDGVKRHFSNRIKGTGRLKYVSA